MKIVFMGTPEFAVPSLEILLKNKYEVAAVVTAPDKPRGRGQQVSFTPVKETALKHSLPLLQPSKLDGPDFVSSLTSIAPDLFVVVAFRILPSKVFSIPTSGAFNLHASLLPKYRGAAPINWAIINGEKESGVTTFFLQEKVDTGNVILQARVAITEAMTAGELHDTLSEVGAEIVLQTVRLIELGKVNPRKQEDSLASPAPKIFKENCRIDWNRPTVNVRNFIRGLSPLPTAWAVHGDKILKIYNTALLKEGDAGLTKQEMGPGSIAIQGNKQMFVATGAGFLEVLELQQEGRKRMSVAEFLKGYTFEKGAKLG